MGNVNLNYSNIDKVIDDWLEKLHQDGYGTCDCCDTIKDKIFYVCVETYEERSKLANVLSILGYEFLDCTGGQYSCSPKGDFEDFKKIVIQICNHNNLTLHTVRHIPDPGLGLF
jgi:hypothetical protein